MTPPRRRWSFGLRTLFVMVTVVACWLGYHVNWIRERHAVLSRQPEGERGSGLQPSPRTGFLLQRLFQEPGIGCIIVGSGVSAAEFNRITSLFPEAIVVQSGSDDSNESITVLPYLPN